MLRKPFLSGLLIAALALVALYFVRSKRHKPRESGVVVSEKQMKTELEDVDEEKLKTPPPEPAPKVTALSAEARAHLAEKAFISELRAVFLWRGGQLSSKKMRGEWLEKLTAIPSDELPVELRSAWKSLLEAWRTLADPAGADDPGLREKGNQAAAILNAMLKEHGDGDIQF